MGDMGDEIAGSLLKGCLKIAIILGVIFLLIYWAFT